MVERSSGNKADKLSRASSGRKERGRRWEGPCQEQRLPK